MAFNKKTWATGQTITATELNRMETGIDDANKTGSGDVGFITNTDVYLESFPRIGGETDDSPRIQRAVNSIPEGGNIIFPSGKSLVLNTTILLDPIDLQTSLTLDLNGSFLQYNGNGIAFDLLSNGWFPTRPEQGWKLGVRIAIQGNGATISGTSSGVGGIRMTDSLNYKVSDMNVWNFPTGYGVQIFISDYAHHCEENILENMWVRQCKIGYQTAMFDGRGTHSMNHTVMRNLKFNGQVNNSIGFDLNGNHSRSQLDGCGGWINEEGSTGGYMFRLNGWFENAVMVAPWIDFGNSKTSNLTFGTDYPSGSSSEFWGGRGTQITITNVTMAYFALPDDAYMKVNVSSFSIDGGNIMFIDEQTETQGFRMNSPEVVKTIYGRKQLMDSAAGAVTQWTRDFEGFKLKKILSVVVTPFVNSIDDNQLSDAGQFGVATLNKNVDGDFVSVTFYRVANGTRNTGFFYEVKGIPVY